MDLSVKNSDLIKTIDFSGKVGFDPLVNKDLKIVFMSLTSLTYTKLQEKIYTFLL